MWTLHSKLLIYHLFKFIENQKQDSKLGLNILKDILVKFLLKLKNLNYLLMMKV